MLKQFPLFLLLILCPFAEAQNTFGNAGGNQALLGPGGIGQRSGRDVDMRFYSTAMFVRDTGYLPYAVTQDGKLLQTGTLEGAEVMLGGYGRHTFRRSILGADYSGNYRHYPSASNYDGINQQLNLQYLIQTSRKLSLSFATYAGTQNFSTVGGPVTTGTDVIVNNGTQLFDNRTAYFQGDMSARYQLSRRTAFTMGGGYYTIHRKAVALVGVNGYNLQGSLERQLSRNTVVGGMYQHIHFDYPRAFGESDLNLYSAFWKALIGRSVEVSFMGGLFTSDVQGVESTALDPAIAALLGIGSVQTIFYKNNTLPLTTASMTKRWRRSSVMGSYSRAVSPGNGVYLTSRMEAMTATFSYTGSRRWSLSLTGSSAKMDSLGQGLVGFRQTLGGSTLNYNLGKGFHFSGLFNYRHQNINAVSFRRDSTRIGLGISFSPGDIPISFH